MRDSSARPGRLSRVFRYGGLSIAAVTFVLVVAHLAWTHSGNGEWQDVSEKDGIRIATLKVPGEVALKYKVNMHVEARLSDVVAFLSETETGNDLGAYDIRRIEEVSAPPVFYAYDTYKLRLPAPFGELEVVIINQYSQDPETKTVRVNVNAAPNKLPLDESIRRVVHLSNSWTLTPLESGGVNMESVSEMDLGMPYVLANLAMPGVIDDEFSKIRTFLKQDKYKNKQPAFIAELHDERPATVAVTAGLTKPD